MTTTGDLLRRFVAMVRGLPENTRDLLHTILLGVASALSAVAFLLLTNYVFKVTYLAFMERSLTFFMTASFCVIMGTSLAVGLLLSKIEPDAAGSGIPQLKAAYWKEVGYVHWRPVLVKFIAGVLSLGGGASLGREGPTVYIGGGLSSVISGFLGYPKRLRRGTMVIGASAGLAAAFNTPLAAITFVLEEIISDINSRIIGRVVLTSVLGAFVVYAIVGRQPAFTLPAIDTVSWKVYVLYPLVALIASLAGVVFQLPRSNLMSYYKDADTLSAVQRNRLHWTLGWRASNKMPSLSNDPYGSGIMEAEDMIFTTHVGCPFGVQWMTPWGSEHWSNGRQVFGGCSNGGEVSFPFQVAQPGYYTLAAYLTHAPDFGIVRLYVDGNPTGSVFDGYGALVAPSGRRQIGSKKVYLAAGGHTIKAKVIGKNEKSSNYFMGIDCFQVN